MGPAGEARPPPLVHATAHARPTLFAEADMDRRAQKEPPRAAALRIPRPRLDPEALLAALSAAAPTLSAILADVETDVRVPPRPRLSRDPTRAP